MSDDSDSEYDESEYVVYADFENQLLPHQLKEPNAAIKIIGIESNHPIAEINGSIFKGTYDLALGTNVFFEKDKHTAPGDPLFENTPTQQYKYFNKTDKVLNFQRVYVEKKSEIKPGVGASDDSEVAETIGETNIAIKSEPTLKPTTTYKGAIKKFCNSE